MAITPSGNNTVALTGIDMFNYFITHFNMSSEDAINEMRAKNGARAHAVPIKAHIKTIIPINIISILSSYECVIV